jgi:DNA polymerase-4
MFIHLVIPGFHAALHQAREPGLRGRAVAVAVDGGAQAPLFAVSLEARAAGILPGLRADQARRRCPELAIRTSDPEQAEEAQRALSALCASCAPLVGAAGAGRFDIDLGGTEPYWGGRLPAACAASPAAQARHLAELCVSRCAGELRLPAHAGTGHRLLSARLAARLARDPALAVRGVHALAATAAQELPAIDPLPADWLSECTAESAATLRGCGITTIGALRPLALGDLTMMLGAVAAGLHATLHGTVPDMVPPQVDPEPSLNAATRCGAGGAGDAEARQLVRALARELGVKLRARQLACTMLTFSGRWLDHRVAQTTLPGGYQLRHDHELFVLAERLLARARTRRVAWERLRLSASGLCAAEEQQELFAPARRDRLESVQDRIRQRFGSDLLRVVGPPLASAGG